MSRAAAARGAAAAPVAAPAARVAAPVLQRTCAACAEPAHDEERLRRRPTGGRAPGPVPTIVHDVLRAPGRPLDLGLRAAFEPKLGRSFADVRVHSDQEAARSAGAVNAEAYTVGRHIVFGQNRYAPDALAGRRLLVHELAHVVQQRGQAAPAALRPTLAIAPANDPAEREAEAVAARVLTGTGPAAAPSQRSALVAARQATSVTVEAPTGPPGCSLEQHGVIAPAIGLADGWLGTAVRKLDDYIAAPAAAAGAAIRAALNRHFHAATVDIARRLRYRIATLRSDIFGRDPFTTECHDTTDPTCTNSGAYVPGTNRSMVVFCPSFFRATSVESRAGSIIHEMAHALLGLQIADRAYKRDRLLPFLSTAEALDNAESHASLVEDLATGRPVAGSPPQDEIEDCSTETAPLVREALGRAQRWNRDSETVANDTDAVMVADNAALFTTHLGDALPATRAAAVRVLQQHGRTARAADRCPVRRQSSSRMRQPAGVSQGGIEQHRIRVGPRRRHRGGVGLAAGIAAGLALGAGVGLFIGLMALGLGALIGFTAGATSSDSIRVCPAWRSLTPSNRAQTLLAAIYETYAGLSPDRSRRYARFAQALHARYIGAPPPV